MTVQPDILIGTKHLYKVGFMPEGRHLRSGFTVVKTGLGPVDTGHGKLITNLKPVESCNLVVNDDRAAAEYHQGREPEDNHFGEPCVQLNSGEHLNSLSLVETDMDLHQTTSVAAGRGPSPHEGHVKELQCNTADLDDTVASTDVSASATDLPVDQNTGFTSLPPDTPLDVRRSFSSFSIRSTSDRSVCQNTWVYEKQSNVLGALLDHGAVITITKDEASASNFPWSKNCQIAQRFLHDQPRGSFNTGFQFDHTGRGEVLCLRDRRFQALVAGPTLRQDEFASDPRQAQNFIKRRSLPYCVPTLIVCCGAGLLYDDTAYQSSEADVRDLATHLTHFYPYLRVRVIHPTFVPDRLDQWSEVTVPAKVKLRNVLAALGERVLMYQTYPLFIDLGVDRYLLKFHRSTFLRSGDATDLIWEIQWTQVQQQPREQSTSRIHNIRETYLEDSMSSFSPVSQVAKFKTSVGLVICTLLARLRLAHI
ncbi:hypothetical protein AAVH_07668 [Aphelenchoides avenae]|nr:hypothetical protein AAVH_07668 [Aphelenchus avenae]